MSTMSEQHRILQEIKMDDSLILQDIEEAKQDILAGEALLSDNALQEILAEDAYHKSQAMREAMPQPSESNEDNSTPF